ncbi:MAG: hypothetical protein A2X52_01175 [Candidatus Rokubacteria bacterium GWC2_70_16]|nr:MAG: hypothetical protein A2X52_01175 [Candidatus Rokubacteria bacterium GWC2_70_16]
MRSSRRGLASEDQRLGAVGERPRAERLGLETLALRDLPADLPPDTRRWATEYAARRVQGIREKLFPFHGLRGRARPSRCRSGGSSAPRPPGAGSPHRARGLT